MTGLLAQKSGTFGALKTGRNWLGWRGEALKTWPGNPEPAFRQGMQAAGSIVDIEAAAREKQDRVHPAELADVFGPRVQPGS